MEEKSSNKTLGIIGVLFLILFIIALFRVLLGSEHLSFAGFLESLTTAPNIEISTSVIDFTILGNWGVFDFARVLVNSLISVVNILAYLAGLLYNLLLTLVWCIKFVIGF